MRSAALVLALGIGPSGCVVGASFIKPHAVSIPILIGAVVLDVAATSILASQAESFSTGATIATDIAVTGLDVGVGCLLDACASLKP
jgi:riboflavin transporter FmnP